MNMNDLKKMLYQQKPVAIFKGIKNGVARYETTLTDKKVVAFTIPVNDMGDAEFTSEMDAKLLIRWIAATT